MATIKSYTSLEQSRKLAEILPLESADMYYCYSRDVYTKEWDYDTTPIIIDEDNQSDICDVPCWSLAALLNVLPTYLFDFERGIDLNIYPNLSGKGWHCSYMPNCIENIKTDKFKLITSGDTLVDACYEMILKLHELNLL